MKTYLHRKHPTIFPKPLVFALFFLAFSSPLFPQYSVQVTVNSGFATTTCTDIFLPIANPAWSVRVAGGPWVDYGLPDILPCHIDLPNQQYRDTIICPADLPDSIEVCFRAFDKDGLFCDMNPDCEVVVCRNYPLPKTAGQNGYTLSIPPGQASGGQVSFTLSTSGLIAHNDLPCDAIDLGILPVNSSIGDASQTSYSNVCATNAGEPSPNNDGYWFNNQGVWFAFTTSANPGDMTTVYVTNDPSGLGDSIDIQLAVYETLDGSCNSLSFLKAWQDRPSNEDEYLQLGCLEPNSTYYILVDGVSDPDSLTEGFFGLEVTDQPVEAGPDFRCDARDLGRVPDGGTIGLTGQSNMCATNTGDPSNPTFGVGNAVWYRFNPPATGHVIIDIVSDQPFPAGIESIDIEVALYASPSDTCTGSLTRILSQYNPGNRNEQINQLCLDPARPYWLMIDGSASDDKGIFNIVITDGGIPPPGSTIDTILCAGESINLGAITYDTSGSYAQVIPLPNGCDSTVNLNLTVLEELVADGVELSPTRSIVLPNGVAGLNVSGGLPPYTYLWSTGDTTATIDSLPAGTYCVTVTDANNCFDTACVVVTELLIYPVVVVNPDTLDCYGDTDGQISFQVTTAQPPYVYQWEGAGGSPSGSGLIPANGGFGSFSGLPAGSYRISVTDAYVLTTIVEVDVIEPDSLQLLLVDSQDPSCYNFCDGRVELEATGGTPPYQYSWPAGKDSAIRSDLCAGDYSIVVTDANGCTAGILVTLANPPEFIAQAQAVQPVTCFGGSDGAATVTTNGNPIDYNWDNGEDTQTATQLDGGLHSVTVTNDDGCMDTTTVFIGSPASPITVDFMVIQPVTCFGGQDGSLQVSASGGAGAPYSYLWQDAQATDIIQNLAAGKYAVEVMDVNGCIVSDTFELGQPSQINAQVIENDATCYDNGNGSLEIGNVSGGNPGYQYSIDGNFFSDNTRFVDLPPDDYEVLVRDAGGCVVPFEARILPPPPVSVDLGQDRVIELGEEIRLRAITANLNAVPSWTPAGLLSCTDCFEPELQPLNNALYVVTVVDTTTGCTASDDIAIQVDKPRNVFIPNAFSPNGDGANDFLTVYGGEDVLIVKRFLVFDRWGALVFQMEGSAPNDLFAGWDGTFRGKIVDPGVYVYLAEIVFIDQVELVYKGSISVVR